MPLKISRRPNKTSRRNQLNYALETLKAAKALLMEVGWAKGELKTVGFYDPITRKMYTVEDLPISLYTRLEAKTIAYCSLGAIEEADGPGEEEAKRLLALTINPSATLWNSNEPYDWTKEYQSEEDIIAEFNDAAVTDRRKVLAKFNAAIKRIEKELAR